MAIQNRRGAYVDFDPTKMVAGEFAVVQSGDENTDDGKALYLALETGAVKRIPFAEELEVDDTLTEAGVAADAKKTGDEITALRDDLTQVFTNNAKQALLNCLEHVVWTNAQGNDYYEALQEALYPSQLERIEAVFEQGSTEIYPDTDLNELREFLIVTAYYEDDTTQVLTDYSLSGTLVVGTSTITVSYSRKTTTFTVTVITNRRADLPTAYNQVEYIRAENGTMYTTLDVVSQIPIRAKAKLNWTSTNETNIIRTGNGIDTADNISLFSMSDFWADGGHYIGARVGFGDDHKWVTLHTNRSFNQIYEVETEIVDVGNGMVRCQIHVDDEQDIASNTVSTINTGYKFQMFKVPLDSWIGRRVNIYYLQMYSGNTKLFDGIPCIRKSDNVTGLYDVVSGKLYSSEGSDNYIVGDIVR